MFFLPCQPNQWLKSQSPANPKPSNPPRRMLSRRSLAPDKTKGLRLLKETPRASNVQKKPAPKSAPDKVENLVKEYLAELKEVDVTFENGTAVLDKYRAKYPELASYIREIVPGERRIAGCLSIARTDVGPITRQTPLHRYSANCTSCSAKPRASFPLYKPNSYSSATRSPGRLFTVRSRGRKNRRTATST